MSEIAKAIDSIVNLELAPYLKSLGFKKKARDFHRQDEYSIAIVNVQASSGNLGVQGRFTLNIGRYFPAIAALEGKALLSGLPKEYESTHRQRIGLLAPMRRDHWWDISPTVDHEAVALEVRLLTESYAVPWLAAIASPEQLYAALQGSNSMTTASVALLLNKREEAARLMKSFLEQRPMAKAHILAWAKRNDLQLD